MANKYGGERVLTKRERDQIETIYRNVKDPNITDQMRSDMLRDAWALAGIAPEQREVRETMINIDRAGTRDEKERILKEYQRKHHIAPTPGVVRYTDEEIREQAILTLREAPRDKQGQYVGDLIINMGADKAAEIIASVTTLTTDEIRDVYADYERTHKYPGYTYTTETGEQVAVTPEDIEAGRALSLVDFKREYETVQIPTGEALGARLEVMEDYRDPETGLYKTAYAVRDRVDPEIIIAVVGDEAYYSAADFVAEWTEDPRDPGTWYNKEILASFQTVSGAIDWEAFYQEKARAALAEQVEEKPWTEILEQARATGDPYEIAAIKESMEFHSKYIEDPAKPGTYWERDWYEGYLDAGIFKTRGEAESVFRYGGMQSVVEMATAGQTARADVLGRYAIMDDETGEFLGYNLDALAMDYGQTRALQDEDRKTAINREFASGEISYQQAAAIGAELDQRAVEDARAYLGEFGFEDSAVNEALGATASALNWSWSPHADAPEYIAYQNAIAEAIERVGRDNYQKAMFERDVIEARDAYYNAYPDADPTRISEPRAAVPVLGQMVHEIGATLGKPAAKGVELLAPELKLIGIDDEAGMIAEGAVMGATQLTFLPATIGAVAGESVSYLIEGKPEAAGGTAIQLSPHMWAPEVAHSVVADPFYAVPQNVVFFAPIIVGGVRTTVRAGQKIQAMIDPKRANWDIFAIEYNISAPLVPKHMSQVAARQFMEEIQLGTAKLPLDIREATATAFEEAAMYNRRVVIRNAEGEAIGNVSPLQMHVPMELYHITSRIDKITTPGPDGFITLQAEGFGGLTHFSQQPGATFLERLGVRGGKQGGLAVKITTADIRELPEIVHDMPTMDAMRRKMHEMAAAGELEPGFYPIYKVWHTPKGVKAEYEWVAAPGTKVKLAAPEAHTAVKGYDSAVTITRSPISKEGYKTHVTAGQEVPFYWAGTEAAFEAGPVVPPLTKLKLGEAFAVLQSIREIPHYRLRPLEYDPRAAATSPFHSTFKAVEFKGVQSDYAAGRATAIVTNANGEVLLVKMWGQDRFDLPGGSPVKGKESLTDAVKRELNEETGLTATSVDPQLSMVGRFKDGGRKHHFVIYEVKTEGTLKPGAEIKEAIWWDGKSQTKHPVAPFVSEALRKLDAHKKETAREFKEFEAKATEEIRTRADQAAKDEPWRPYEEILNEETARYIEEIKQAERERWKLEDEETYHPEAYRANIEFLRPYMAEELTRPTPETGRPYQPGPPRRIGGMIPGQRAELDRRTKEGPRGTPRIPGRPGPDSSVITERTERTPPRREITEDTSEFDYRTDDHEGRSPRGGEHGRITEIVTSVEDVTPEQLVWLMGRSKWEGAQAGDELGAVTWPQGKLLGKDGELVQRWFVLSPPYGPGDLVNQPYPPPGAHVVDGPDSAYKAIQALGGPAPVHETIDMGIMDVVISAPGRPGQAGAIRYRPDPKQKTSHLLKAKKSGRKGKGANKKITGVVW